MKEPPFDLATAHRWFAIDLNNQAWDLVEAAERTPEQSDRMIHAAHAACYHWLQAGGAINQLRGECLLATAYALAGHSDAAMRHSDKCMELSRSIGDEQTPFDRATAYGCAAKAYRSAGRNAEALKLHEAASRAAADLSDPGDREVFDRLYSM